MSDEPSPLLLPEGARLFHVGVMKTGTTALQRALAAQRQLLLDSGVRYPGNEVNHRLPVGAFMQARVLKHARQGAVGQAHKKKAADPSIPPMSEWTKLIDEIEGDSTRRSVISYEIAANAADARAQQFVDAIGERTHIVITLRNLAAILPSFWAQVLKSAHTTPLNDWLVRAFGDDPDAPVSAALQRALNHGELVQRWASIVGPENVTVVIVDSSQPDLITEAFEQLLGLETGVLTNYKVPDSGKNRSLRLQETELLLRVNQMCEAHSVDWNSYVNLVKRGVVTRLKSRTPGDDEPRVRLPSWAAARCAELGADHAEQIKASGVRIIGDLASLYPQQSSSAREDGSLAQIPTDIALESVAGVISRATNRGAHFAKPKQRVETGSAEGTPKKKRPDPSTVASSFTTRELATALRIRLAHRLRTRRSKPLKN